MDGRFARVGSSRGHVSARFLGAAEAGPDQLEDIMSEPGLVDVTGRLRSPAATPGHWTGYAPPNKGLRYPADPPTVEEIILVMRQAGVGVYADRIRGLIAILWRAGDLSAGNRYTRDRRDGPPPPTAGDSRERRPAA